MKKMMMIYIICILCLFTFRDDDEDEEENKSPENIEITYSDEEKEEEEGDDDDDDEDDEIERIVDRRVEPSGLIDYKIHWKNTDSDADEWFARPKLLSMYTNMVVEYEENHRLLSTPANQFRRSIMPSPSSVPRLSISRPITPVMREEEEIKEVKHDNISATIIQRNYREYYQKKRQRLLQHLAQQIYIAYRNNKLILAVIKIQSFFRKCLATVIVNQLKEEKEKELKLKQFEEEEGVGDGESVILPDPIKFPDAQDEIRSFNSFRVIEEGLKVPKEIDKAIRLIQKTYKIHKYHIKSLEEIINDRIKKKKEKNKRKLNKEKLKIQLFLSKYYRGKKVRKMFKKRVEMMKMVQLFVSKRFRGKKVRKEYKERIENMKIVQLWLSKHYRGRKQRKEYKIIKNINEEEFNNKINNIIIIQKYIKKYINQKKYLRIKKSIVVIQSIVRMYINKYRYKIIHSNTIKIQKFLHSKYNYKKQNEINMCKEIIENDIIYNKVYNEIDIKTKEKVILFIQKHYRGKRGRLYFKKLKHILILLNEFKYMKKASLNQEIYNNNINNNKINIIKQRNVKDRIYFQCYAIPNKNSTKGIIDIWTCSFHQKVFLSEIYEYINNNHINIDYKCGSMISFLFENITSNITVTEQNCDIFYMWDFPVRFPIHYTINNNNSKNLYEEIRISVYLLGVFYCILNVKIPTKFNNNNNPTINYYKIRTTLTYIIPEPHLHNNNNLAVLLIDDSIISPTNPIINQTINQLKDREYGIYILSNKLITNYSIEIMCKLYLNILSIKWNQLFILSLLLVEKQIVGPVVENPIYEPPENNYILTYNDHIYRNSFSTLSTESISSISSSTVTSDNSNNNISKIEVSKFLKLFHSIPSNYILVYIPQLSFNIFIPSNFDNNNSYSNSNNNSEYMQIISSIITPSKFLQIFNQTLSTLKERMSIEMFASKLNKMNNNSTFMRNVLKSMILVKMKELFVFGPTEYSINNNYDDENNIKINELLIKYKNYEYQVRLIQKWFINRIEYKYKVNTKRINRYKKIIKESTLSLNNTKPKLHKSMNYLIHTNRILKYRNIKHKSPQQLENEINSFNNNNNTIDSNNNDNKIYEETIEKQNKEIKELKSQLDSLKKKIFEIEKEKEKSPSEEEEENDNNYNYNTIYKPTPPPSKPSYQQQQQQQQKPQLFKYTHIFTPEPDPDVEITTTTTDEYIRTYNNNNNNNNNRRIIKPTPPPSYSSSSRKRHSSASGSFTSHRSIRRSLF